MRGRFKQIRAKYPVETNWRLFVVRALDRRNVFRQGVVLETPIGSRTIEFRTIPSPEERNFMVGAAVAQAIDEAPWWERPDRLIVDELSLFDFLPTIAALSALEFDLLRNKRHRNRAQKRYKKYAENNPRFDRRRLLSRGDKSAHS